MWRLPVGSQSIRGQRGSGGGHQLASIGVSRLVREDSLDSRRRELREFLVQGLEDAGFTVGAGVVTPPAYPDKDSIRRMYVEQRKQFVESKGDLLDRLERRALHYFAAGDEVCPAAISPRIEPVVSSLQSDIYRYACLLWSIPVSQGFGRRMRFLVFDDSNNKLIGVFGLCDPVYCLKVRDSWIGWTDQDKRLRLWHAMDANVLGAVPPYNYLLGGKLIALLATSNEVRDSFVARYGERRSEILGLVRDPHLVLLTTTAALGRSSMLNRLKRNGEAIWQSLGMTLGWGHFHLGNGHFEEIARFMREERPEVFKSYKYGGGPSWKLRVIRACLRELGLPPTALQHGIKRESFASPLARNWREFLHGEETEPEFHNRPAEELMSFFRERWLLARAQREHRHRHVSLQDIQQQVRVAS